MDDHSEPQPDIALLKPRADFYRNGHPSPEDVYLLIEVSEASLALDRQVKLPAYGKSGIPEVWIVNLEDRVIETYREPHCAGYNSEVVLRIGDQARLQAFPDVAIKVADLLCR